MLYTTDIANRYRMKTSFVLYFHARIVYILSKNFALKDGGIISVNDGPVIIYLNWFPFMDTCNHIGSPQENR